MKTYIVYIDGNEMGYIKAASHNAAEKKARKKYAPKEQPNTPAFMSRIQVAYTEVSPEEEAKITD
jgi:hypothetical protein